MGNRKPRRTQKGHPHAGRMGNEHITLKNVPLVDTLVHDGSKFLAVK
jgi:ribosomal protein L3